MRWYQKKWNKYHNDEIDPDRSKKRWYQKNQARIEWTIMRWSDLTCYDIAATGGGRAAGETRGWGVSSSALTTSTPSPRHKCDILSNPRSWNNIPMSVWIFDHGTPSPLLFVVRWYQALMGHFAESTVVKEHPLMRVRIFIARPHHLPHLPPLMVDKNVTFSRVHGRKNI